MLQRLISQYFVGILLSLLYSLILNLSSLVVEGLDFIILFAAVLLLILYIFLYYLTSFYNVWWNTLHFICNLILAGIELKLFKQFIDISSFYKNAFTIVTLCIIAGLFIVSNKIILDVFFNYTIKPKIRKSIIDSFTKKIFS